MDDRGNQGPPRPVMPFVLSLIAGLWMLSMGGWGGWAQMSGHPWGVHMGEAGHHGARTPDWMWRHHTMMYGYGSSSLWVWTGTIAGLVVLAGAVLLFAKPATARPWGIVIVVVSAAGLFAGAGGLLAGLLGILGGILAITWRPPMTSSA